MDLPLCEYCEALRAGERLRLRRCLHCSDGSTTSISTTGSVPEWLPRPPTEDIKRFLAEGSAWGAVEPVRNDLGASSGVPVKRPQNRRGSCENLVSFAGEESNVGTTVQSLYRSPSQPSSILQMRDGRTVYNEESESQIPFRLSSDLAGHGDIAPGHKRSVLLHQKNGSAVKRKEGRGSAMSVGNLQEAGDGEHDRKSGSDYSSGNHAYEMYSVVSIDGSGMKSGREDTSFLPISTASNYPNESHYLSTSTRRKAVCETSSSVDDTRRHAASATGESFRSERGVEQSRSGLSYAVNPGSQVSQEFVMQRDLQFTTRRHSLQSRESLAPHPHGSLVRGKYHGEDSINCKPEGNKMALDSSDYAGERRSHEANSHQQPPPPSSIAQRRGGVSENCAPVWSQQGDKSVHVPAGTKERLLTEYRGLYCQSHMERSPYDTSHVHSHRIEIS